MINLSDDEISKDYIDVNKIYGLSFNNILIKLEPYAVYDLYIPIRLLFMFSGDYKFIIDNTWFDLYHKITKNKCSETNLTKLISKIILENPSKYPETNLYTICNENLNDLNEYIKYSLNLGYCIKNILNHDYGIDKITNNMDPIIFDVMFLGSNYNFIPNDFTNTDKLIYTTSLLNFGTKPEIPNDNYFTSYNKINNPITFMVWLHDNYDTYKDKLPIKYDNSYAGRSNFNVIINNGSFNKSSINDYINNSETELKLSSIIGNGNYMYVKMLYINVLYYLFGDVDANLFNDDYPRILS